MELDTKEVYIAVANSQLETKEILKKAKITHRTWYKAAKGLPIRPQTAGRIAKALSVPVETLLKSK